MFVFWFKKFLYKSMTFWHLVLCFSGVKHPNYPSVLDSLIISSPVITNCLIDMRGIESILIIKVSVCSDFITCKYAGFLVIDVCVLPCITGEECSQESDAARHSS